MPNKVFKISFMRCPICNINFSILNEYTKAIEHETTLKHNLELVKEYMGDDEEFNKTLNNTLDDSVDDTIKEIRMPKATNSNDIEVDV